MGTAAALSSDSKTKKCPPGKRYRTRIETLQLGVYRVMLEQRMPSMFDFDIAESYEKWLGAFKLLERLVRDVFKLAPGLILVMALVKAWDSLEEVALLALETRLLKIIEIGLTSGNGLDARAVIFAVLARILFVMCSTIISYQSRELESRVRDRVRHYFDDYLLITRLQMDLPSLQENRSDEHLSSGVPWQTFNTLLDLGTKLFAVASQLGFIFYVARSGNHGVVFAVLCVGKPAIQTLVQQTIWSMPRVVEATDSNFLRMRSLQSLDKRKYRMDILSGNLLQYIISEFRKSRTNLGETSTEWPEMQYYQKRSIYSSLIAGLFGDFPLVYYAAIALLNPSTLSLSTIASLQQSAILLRWSFWSIFYEADSLRQDLSRVQHLYDLEKAPKVIEDGDLPYPSEKESTKGMGFELQNVSFSYPGSKDDAKALDDVSFRIDPGELVVIVGANGSGKSTFVKLMTRLYDANTGTVLVDGEDIRRYKLAELRQTMAALTQDHVLFPLSIAENIGLGHPEAMDDMGMVEKAAEKGGAAELLKKLNNGVKTILDPFSIQYGANVEEDDETELAGALKKLQKTIEVSGGERQRLVASRTFMRFNSNQIKLVAVDEPSSALDPEGELALFNNLKDARDGKTMVFVTHRFGHLTKYADKILCMKDGKVVECGTHTDLISKDGEYAKMYNIQAKAFETDSKTNAKDD